MNSDRRDVPQSGSDTGPLSGQVIASRGHHYLVACGDAIVECITRGKKTGVAYGDRVSIALTHAGSGVIEGIEARGNLLYRSDEMRSKLIAANVDQAAIVVAAVPYFREELLIRCLVACETADIPALIVLNKTDLPETATLATYLAHYEALGYPLLRIAARHGDEGGLAQLEQRLRDRVTVLVGASGVGKSTLLNRLVPEARAATGEISLALDAGKHTTTHARMYRLASGGALIDSPGMQEFGLRHLKQAALMDAFPEIRARAGQCRFYNCRHLKEPGCAVLDAARDGTINPSRLRVYHSLLGQLSS